MRMKTRQKWGNMKIKLIIGMALVLLVSYAAFAQTNYITTIVNNISIGDAFEIFVDTTNNWVGIGTSSPSNTLDVVGDANVTGDLWVAGRNLTVDFQRFTTTGESTWTKPDGATWVIIEVIGGGGGGGGGWQQ